MVCWSSSSQIERRPRAPVLRASAFLAISCSASGSNTSSTPSSAGDDALGGLAHGGGRRLILVHIEIVHGLGVIHVRAKGTHHLVLREGQLEDLVAGLNAFIKGTHHLVLREGQLEDLVAGLNAFIADEHAVLALDELANLLLGLPAERAANLAVALHAGGAAELVARH